MPTESIVFSPEISERDLDREVAGVNDQLEDAASGIGADFDADMDALTPPGGGGGLSAGGGGMLALAENRNDLLVDIRESLQEDFVGDDGGGGGGVSSILMGALGAGGGGGAGATGAGLVGGGALLTWWLSGLSNEQLNQTPDAEDTTGARDDTAPEGGTPLGEAGWPELPEEIKALTDLSWPEVPATLLNLMEWSFPVVPDTIRALTSLEWPSMPNWMDPLSVDWPGMPSWMSPLEVTWPEPPGWVQRFLSQNRVTGGAPSDIFEGDRFGRPSNRGEAIRQNQSEQRGGTRGPLSVDIDAPIQVDPDRLVRDIARELEPVVEREINDLRDEITSVGSVF